MLKGNIEEFFLNTESALWQIIKLYLCILKVVQCLDNEHRSSVVKVAWTKTSCASKHLADRMTLASSDASGKILVIDFNIKTYAPYITVVLIEQTL